jgi:hypothetical protein
VALCRRLLRRSAAEPGRVSHGGRGPQVGCPPPAGVDVPYPLSSYSFKDYPQRQKAASFNMDEVMKKLQESSGSK